MSKLKFQLYDGMSFEDAIRVLGPPTRTIGGGDVLGAFGHVGGAGVGAVAGMSFLEWKLPEGTFRANLRGVVLDDINGWVD